MLCTLCHQPNNHHTGHHQSPHWSPPITTLVTTNYHTGHHQSPHWSPPITTPAQHTVMWGRQSQCCKGTGVVMHICPWWTKSYWNKFSYLGISETWTLGFSFQFVFFIALLPSAVLCFHCRSTLLVHSSSFFPQLLSSTSTISQSRNVTICMVAKQSQTSHQYQIATAQDGKEDKEYSLPWQL